jgi:hypothetical protein
MTGGLMTVREVLRGARMGLIATVIGGSIGFLVGKGVWALMNCGVGG